MLLRWVLSGDEFKRLLALSEAGEPIKIQWLSDSLLIDEVNQCRHGRCAQL